MFEKQLEVAINTIKKASKEILKIYHEGFQVNLKEDNSVVTNADLASEKIIIGELTKAFPTYAILSEESADDLSRLDNEYCWIIDPLDGTKDFVNKTNYFAINIALSYKNEIVVGVICVPCKDIIYYATKGNGAYKIENGKTLQIHVSNKVSHLKMLTSMFFFKDKDKFKDIQLIESMEAIGSSYKAGLIAEGKAELCVKEDAHTKQWDTAPSEVIISEAGGKMCNIYGEKYIYNRQEVYNNDGFIIANNFEVLNAFKKTR